MRSDLKAALDRADALERELKEAERRSSASSAELEQLRAQVREQQAELKRLRRQPRPPRSINVGLWLHRVAWLTAIGAAVVGFIFVRGRSCRSPEKTQDIAELIRGCEQQGAASCFYLGRRYELANDLPRAIAAYRKSCQLGGAGGGSACFNAGVLLVRKGDLAAAEAPTRVACERYDHGAACGNLATLLLERKLYPEAERAGRRGCERRWNGRVAAPRDANACNNLSIALWRQKRIVEAASAGEEACGAGLDLGCAAWAHMSLLLGHGEVARKAVARGFGRNNAREGLWRARGHIALFIDHDVQQALRQYREAIRLSAHNEAEEQQAVREMHSRAVLDEIHTDLDELRSRYPDSAPDVERCWKALKATPPETGRHH